VFFFFFSIQDVFTPNRLKTKEKKGESKTKQRDETA